MSEQNGVTYFCNLKANKLYLSTLPSSPSSASSVSTVTDLQIYDSYLEQQNGNSYQQSLYSQPALKTSSASTDTNTNTCSNTTSSSNTDGNTYTNISNTGIGNNNHNIFVPFGYDRQYGHVYAMYGYRIEEAQANFIRLMLVKTIHERVYAHNIQDYSSVTSRGISIVYFTSAQPISSTNNKQKKIKSMEFSVFKNQVLKRLELKYLRHIRQVYVCHQSFMNRLPFSFGGSSQPKSKLYNQIVQSLIKYCDSLESLIQNIGVLFECQFIREEVQVYNKSTKFMDIFTALDRKQAKRKMQEEVGDEHEWGGASRKALYKNKLADYISDYSTGIPILLSALLSALQNNPVYLHSEGLFRKACNPEKLKQLESQLADCLMEEQMVSVISKYDADTIACCIKNVFNKLKTPVISFEFYEKMIHKMETMSKKNREQRKQLQQQQSDANILRVESLKSCITAQLQPYKEPEQELEHASQTIGTMPPTQQQQAALKSDLSPENICELLAFISYFIGSNQRQILLRLIHFFRESVLPNEKYNKMSAYNLSVVMSPCIFRPKKYSVEDLVNSGRLVCAFYELIMDPIKLQ